MNLRNSARFGSSILKVEPLPSVVLPRSGYTCLGQQLADLLRKSLNGWAKELSHWAVVGEQRAIGLALPRWRRPQQARGQ